MGKINRHNYEVFFIDYFDGNLSSDQTEELYQFLNENPDLKTEFENFEEIPLENNKIDFLLKEKLKKKSFDIINKSNFKEYCIAFVEDDLNENEKQALFNYIENNDLQKEFELYKNTKLNAVSGNYQEKDGLKKLLIDNNIKLNKASLEEYIIAYHEGDLSLENQTQLKLFINSNEIYPVLFSEYKNVFLQPQNIVFEHKASLKKFSLVAFSKRVIPYASVAAVLLFFVVLFSTNDNRNEMSSLTEVEKKSVVKQGETKNNEKTSDEKREGETKKENVIKNNESKIPTNNSFPIREKQSINPLKKTSKIISFEGKVQIASIIEKPKNVKEIAFVKDLEFEQLLAENKKEKEERFYKLDELVAEKVKKDILKTDEDKFSLWYVAQAGARGLSKLTGKNYEVETGVDEHGNVTLMAFNSDNFEYSRTKK